jgi:CRP-like cAMP-binding protein
LININEGEKMTSGAKRNDDYAFFSFLKEEDLKRLKDISFKKSYKKGEILFYKGEESKYLHLLIRGIVKLYTHDFKDNEVVIHNLMGPSLIAEIVNYEEINFLANCAFETDSDVLLIDYKKFKEEFLLKPEITMFFIKSLTKKIKFLENFINYNITLNSMEKIAKFLYENEEILKKLRQVKIAQILNITPETFSRQLAKLKKAEIIENEKGSIKILKHEELKKFITSY